MTLFDAPGASPETALSVAAVTTAAREVLEGAFPPVWVKGEVSTSPRIATATGTSRFVTGRRSSPA